MTAETVNSLAPIVMASLTALGAALAYIHVHVMPQVKDLYKDFHNLHEGHALNSQQIETQTARLNGQSAKIDALKDVVTLAPAVADPMPLLTALAGVIHTTQDKTAEMQQKTVEMNRQVLLDGIKSVDGIKSITPETAPETALPVGAAVDPKPAGTEGD